MAICRGCGATIEFITSPNGSDMPAQKVRSVYESHDHGDAKHLQKVVMKPRDDGQKREFYVSHFEICPNASSFTRRR